MTRFCLFALFFLSTTARADEKPPALKKLAEVEVKGVNWLAVSGKGKELAVCTFLNVQIHDADSLKRTKTYIATGNRAAFVLNDSALVVAGVLQNGIELLDRKTGETRSLNDGDPDFHIHPTRDLLAYRGQGKDGKTIIIHDLAKGKIVKRWEPGSWVGSPGLRGFFGKGVLAGDCIKTTRRDGKTTLVDCLIVWPTPFDKDPVLVECSSDPKALALSPDGKTAALGNDRKIDIWDLAKGKQTGTLTAPLAGGRVMVLAYSPDGKKLAALVSRNADRRRGLTDTGETEVVVYDAATLKVLARTEAHRSPAMYMVFYPDGKRLATAGRFDNLVRTWGVP